VLVDRVFDDHGNEVAAPSGSSADLKLVTLPAFIPLYPSDAIKPGMDVPSNIRDDFHAFLGEQAKKFGYPYTLKFAFTEDGEVLRTLADLPLDQSKIPLILVSKSPSIHILTRKDTNHSGEKKRH